MFFKHAYSKKYIIYLSKAVWVARMRFPNDNPIIGKKVTLPPHLSQSVLKKWDLFHCNKDHDIPINTPERQILIYPANLPGTSTFRTYDLWRRSYTAQYCCSGVPMSFDQTQRRGVAYLEVWLW